MNFWNLLIILFSLFLTDFKHFEPEKPNSTEIASQRFETAMNKVKTILENSKLSYDQFAKIHILSYELEVTAPKSSHALIEQIHDSSEANDETTLRSAFKRLSDANPYEKAQSADHERD